jgi:hypothetical protein
MARTIVETDDTAGDTSVGTGIYAYGSRVLKRGMTGSDVKRMQMGIGMSDRQQDGIFGPITEAKVKEWQAANKLGVRTAKQLSEIDPSLRGTEDYGLYTIVTYVGDGIIDADDWEVLLRYVSRNEDHPMLHGDMFDESVAEALAEHSFDLKGRDPLTTDLGVAATINPGDSSYNDGAEEITPPVKNTNHPMYGNYE